jgi:hypothetical protein
VASSAASGIGTGWPPGPSGRTLCHQKRRPCGKTRLEQRSKEVLMVRTAVRVIELSTCDVQMFKARHVIGRAGL